MVTVNANFENLTGGGTGYVVISLINFGNNVPRVSGTGVIINPVYQSDPGSDFSTSLYGNDAITPSNTYYQVDFYTGTNFISTGIYQFTGSGTYDLSQTSPITVTPTLPLGYATPIIYPSLVATAGVVNGMNPTFTFTAPGSPSPTIMVFAGGVFQTEGGGNDYTYTYSGSNTWTITFNSGSIPSTGPVVVQIFTS
jgi:hypothetical protein